MRASGTFWMELCHCMHFRHPTDGQLLHSDIILLKMKLFMSAFLEMLDKSVQG